MEDFRSVISDAYMLATCAFGLLLTVNVYFLVQFGRASIREPRLLRLLRAVAVFVFSAGAYFAVSLLLPLAPIAPSALRVAFLFLLVLWVCTEFARLWLGAVSPKPLGRVFRVMFSLCFLAVGAFLLRDVPAITATPDGADAIELNAPFEGTWVAVHAGPSTAANHHVRIPEQNYAADLTMVGPNGDIRRGEKDDQTDFWSFGAKILSPVDGIVVRAVDGRPDGVIPTDWNEIAGNHVFIEISPNVYVALAHLQEGSVLVKEGDVVVSGQQIGLSGNSGNSDMPHLHIHVQDQPRLARGATALPWSIEGRSITRNDVIEGR